MRASRILALFVIVLLPCNSLAGDSPRERSNFDAGWHFVEEDVKGAEAPGFDHSGWRALDLPHDWSVEGAFDPDAPAGAPGGYLPCGTGWYRKAFEAPASWEGKKVFIEFDAIHMNGEVWINGHRLGRRPYGYLPHHYDLTGHLDYGGENVIAVRVDNELQPASRWYTGSGIYRHVWLTVTDPLRVARHGTFVTTPEITDEAARVEVETTITNGHAAPRKVIVQQCIFAARGDYAQAITTETVTIEGGAEAKVRQSLELERPVRWSPDNPHLYRVQTNLIVDRTVVDRYETPLGVREIRWDAAKGLFVNGVNMKMKGMCNHHDLGVLGAALWDDALERRLVMLKEMGCNAIRTAHNPSSTELLEMCDRMGFLVINETFDEWRRGWAFEDGTLVSSKEPKGKARHGYNKYFDEWAEIDLTEHMQRDRNHPSVILWSVGNEVPEAQKYGEVETLKWLRDLCHELDPTRLMTVGCNFIEGANATGFTEHMDVVGYNGGGGSCWQYEADKARYPDRLMYASEVPHSLQTRGEYRTRSRYREPERQPPHLTEEEVFPETDGYYESSYDNAGVRISARDSWRLTSTLPYFAGEFRWTGFDYIGESGGWPRVLGNFGIIDLCHFPKDTYYFYQSRWTDEPMAHLLPHWTWPGKEGTEIPVWCYTNAEEAELFLNGESLGTRAFNEEFDMHLQWMVPYTPGELKVVARTGGEVVATSVRKTAGAPKRVVITPDREVLEPGGRKLSYVTIRIEDEHGTLVPKADNWVSLSLDGPGRIVGIGNGDPLCHEPYQGVRAVPVFNGLALAIIASDPKAVAAYERRRRPNRPEPPGIVVKASSRSLEGDEAVIKVAE